MFRRPDLLRPRLVACTAATLLVSAIAAGQSEDVPRPEIVNDSDPTKPVLFSLRNEYSDLGGENWRDVTILRFDEIVLHKTDLPGKARGIILRGDLPVVAAHVGEKTHFGLGDLYAQALIIPKLGRFTIAYGSGFVFPTASSDFTGFGKWQIAPAVAPVYFLPRQGFAFVKVQNFFSVAGESDRPDISYRLVTPTALWRLSKSWFMLVDAESRTDWKQDGQTSYRSGLEIGTMLSPRFGVWVKAEVPWGPHRQATWTLKATGFWTRY